ENSSIKSKNLFDFLLEYMLNSNEKCLNCYKGLEGYSLNPNFNSNDLPFKNLESEIINLFQILKISEILSIKNKSLLDFIFEMQEYIEKLYYQHGNCLKEITFKKNQTIETKNKTIQNKDDLLNFQAQYGTAKSRIQNQLSYKLGQTMIVNSKSFLGCLLMPVILLGIVISYKQEQKIYKRKIEKDPSLKLPSLEQYPDYREAIKLKNHLSYKLGQSAIKFCKNPLKLWSLPYEIFKIIKNK
ncbi:hypothetical protein K6810_001821, partial [Campylobacter coli]|nr:hypothetical protein [Campylobacter coli]